MENSPAFYCFWFNRNSNLGIDNHNSQPYASERLYINQIELDNSVSARLLKEEIYSSIRGNYFYIKEIETDGTLVDILLYDQRNKDEALSYTAKQAFIARDEDKTTYICKTDCTVN